MIDVLALLVFAALCGLVYWLMDRHSHRWTAWSDPIDQPRGYPLQLRRCKDETCRKAQMRSVA